MTDLTEKIEATDRQEVDKEEEEETDHELKLVDSQFYYFIDVYDYKLKHVQRKVN